jgi:anti-sigma-K factor RskA
MKESNPDRQMHPRLAEQLRRRQGPPVSIPGHVDERIRRQMERHFTAQQPAGSVWHRILAFWRYALQPRDAAVVVVMILGVLGFSLLYRNAGRQFTAPAIAHQVTVVDALQLARALETGDRQALRDVNGDGTVNSQDVEALMQQVVKL